MLQGRAPGKLPQVSFSLSDVLCMWISSSKETFRNHVSSEESTRGAGGGYVTAALEEKDGVRLQRAGFASWLREKGAEAQLEDKGLSEEMLRSKTVPLFFPMNHLTI